MLGALRKRALEFVQHDKPFVEYQWKLDYCPHCGCKGMDIATFSFMYYVARNCLIYYWVCHKCAAEHKATSKKYKLAFNEKTEISLIAELDANKLFQLSSNFQCPSPTFPSALN